MSHADAVDTDGLTLEGLRVARTETGTKYRVVPDDDGLTLEYHESGHKTAPTGDQDLETDAGRLRRHLRMGEFYCPDANGAELRALLKERGES